MDFIWREKFTKALRSLPDEDRLKLMDAITEYGSFGNAPKLSDGYAAVFTMIRADIDDEDWRYES